MLFVPPLLWRCRYCNSVDVGGTAVHDCNPGVDTLIATTSTQLHKMSRCCTRWVPRYQPAAEEKLGLLEYDDNLRLVTGLLLILWIACSSSCRYPAPSLVNSLPLLLQAASLELLAFPPCSS